MEWQSTYIRKFVVLSTRSQRDVSRDNGWRILKRHVTDKRQKMYSTCTQRARVERERWKRPISLNGLVAHPYLVFPRILNNRCNLKHISLNTFYRSCENNLNIEFSLMIIDFKIDLDSNLNYSNCSAYIFIYLLYIFMKLDFSWISSEILD